MHTLGNFLMLTYEVISQLVTATLTVLFAWRGSFDKQHVTNHLLIRNAIYKTISTNFKIEDFTKDLYMFTFFLISVTMYLPCNNNFDDNFFSLLTTKQETAKDGKARLQSIFQNLNAKVNQNVDVRQTDIQTLIHRSELLCNLAKYQQQIRFSMYT